MATVPDIFETPEIVCLSCRRKHVLKFSRFSYETGSIATHWAACPNSGEPIVKGAPRPGRVRALECE